MTRITATRRRDLVLITAGIGLIGWLALRQWYGSLPPLHWYVPISLAVLGVVEFVLGRQLRARIQRKPGTEPVQPLVAAQALALAKASAIVGAAALGAWLALLLYAVPRLDYLAAAGNDTRTGVVGAVSSLTLLGAALWLEYCCRTPEPPDERKDMRPNGVRPT